MLAERTQNNNFNSSFENAESRSAFSVLGSRKAAITVLTFAAPAIAIGVYLDKIPYIKELSFELSLANVVKVTALCAGTYVVYRVINKVIGHGGKILETASTGLNGLTEIKSKLNEATSEIENSLSSMGDKEKTRLMDDRSRLSVRNASKYLLHKYGIWDFKSFSREGNNNNNNILNEKEQKLILAFYFNIRSFSDIVKKEEEKAAKERQEAAEKEVKNEEPKEAAVTEVKKEEPKEEAADLEKTLEEIQGILKENKVHLSCEMKLADFKRLIELNALAKKPEMPECVIQ